MPHLCTIRKLSDPLQSFKTAVKENPLNLPLNHITSRTDKLQLALQRGRLWKPRTIIKVSIDGASENLKSKIMTKARQWEQFAAISLQTVSGDADIRIKVTDSNSSWSYVGTDCLGVPKNENTMEFGWLNDQSEDEEINRVVVHEFGHALGCIHEHQNPSVNIPWDTQAVYNYYARAGWDKQTVDNNIFETYEKSATNFSDFDKESIMLYAIPNELTVGDYEVGWNTQMSGMDKQFIGTIYPKSQKPTVDISRGTPMDALYTVFCSRRV